jgi:Na+-transporting NADH:ubiquinone oxidoreductase subunit NqrD
VVFALFACLAALSALIMSMGLLINYRFFTTKLMDSFLHYNYLIFGPYLLGACVLSLFYFNNVVYNCDKELKEKTFNIATFITIFICLIISFCITLGQSVYVNTIFWVDSIRDGPNGSKLMGKIFWKIALSRRNNHTETKK